MENELKRRGPVIPFLDRDNPVNRCLGILFRRLFPFWREKAHDFSVINRATDPGEVRGRLISTFEKIAAGHVTREGGALFLRDLLATRDREIVLKELTSFAYNPPSCVHKKTVLHTLMITRNSAFTDLLAGFLEHEDEDLSVFAAKGLASIRSEKSKQALVRHLNASNCHVRKASAEALIDGFGREGVAALKEHILTCPLGYYFRLTSAEALLKGGDEGLRALSELTDSKDPLVLQVGAAAMTKRGSLRKTF